MPRLAKPRPWATEAKLIVFCEHLAETGSVRASGKAIGLTGRQSYMMFDQVRAPLGGQAV